MKFEDITKDVQLIEYLDSVNDRLKNRKYIYHYTTVEKCIKMFLSRVWFLSNAKDMNDQLEFKNGDGSRWENIFFASFMSDVDESIGMWSMYSQPWRDGVQIAIPVDIAKKWINNITVIREISCDNYQPTGREITVDKKNRVFLSSVAYTNCDNDAGEEQRLTWSNAKNNHILNPSHHPMLTGYIKDSAWDYEKEIRVKAVINNIHRFKRVAIDIPDTVFDNMIITASPLFEGLLKTRMEEEIKRDYNIDKSIFTGRIKIPSACDNCSLKKTNSNNP